MIWKFSGAALITFFLFTLNPYTTAKAQSPVANNNPGSNIAAALPFTSGRSGSAVVVPARTATIMVRVVDSSGVPLRRQAVVQLLSGDAAATTAPIGLAATKPSSSATFQGLQAHRYTIEASAAGYETARLQLQTYPHDTYYQAVLRLHSKPAAESQAAPLNPQATEQAEKGLAALEAGDFGRASRQFRKALALAPRNPDLNFLLGVSLFESHHLQSAQLYLQRAADLNPQHVPSLVALGRVRLQQREFNQAAAPLKKAVSLNPKAWGAHLLLGSVYLVRREFVAAVEQTREAIQLGQAAANGGGLQLGEALAAQGQRQQAREVLANFVHAAPANPAAPAARKLLERLNRNAPVPNAELVDAALISARAVPIANAGESGIPWHSWHPEGVDQEELPMAAGVVCPAQSVLDNTTQRVDEFVADVNRFDAAEHLLNQDIGNSGKVLSTEHRKFDYVVSINKLPSGFLAVDESRNGTDGYANFPDQIETLGLPTLALVFHQRYRDGYQFHCEGLGEWRGQATWLMHFRQRADRAPRMRGYNIGGVLYPISLVGRAWISADTFQIVHMEADLMGPIPKIKLRYEHQAIDYGPVSFQQGHTELWVPTRTSLYFEFRGHKYHRIQSYSHFLLFSVTATEKISPPKQVAMKHQSTSAPPRARVSQAQRGAGGTR